MAFVQFTSHLTRFFPDLAEGEVPGDTVRDVLEALEKQHRGLSSFIVDERGRLRMHVNIFVGDEPVGDRERLSDPVAPGQVMFIVQALSGG